MEETHVLSIVFELLAYALAVAGVGWLFHSPALAVLAAAAVILHIARALEGAGITPPAIVVRAIAKLRRLRPKPKPKPDVDDEL
jgi:hypothetical protein